MTDFLDAFAREFERLEATTPIAERPRLFPDGTGRHAFTGLRCDHAGCTGSLLGKTETRDDLHALTARAEVAGWQCLFIKGESKHWCPQHLDPAREHVRRFK